MILEYANSPDGDLLIENGDFVRADCTQSIAIDLALMQKADCKALPYIGAGARMFLGGKPDYFFSQRLIAMAKLININIKSAQTDGKFLLINV